MLDDKSVQPTANKNAIVGVVKFFAALIIIGGITYSEILFLGIVSSLFPSGPMMIGAMLGAVTTGVSILVLCLGKSHWFRPGTQLIVAWIFTGVEIAVLILNDILAYQIHQGGALDTYMASWRLFCVAAPVVSIVGWILVFYMDPERAIMHRRMEMDDKVARTQIDYEARMHGKTMALRIKAADMALAKFEEKVETKLENHLDMAAAKYAARVASQLTGEHVSHTELLGPGAQQQLSAPKVVESLPSPARAASKDHVVDPGKVKPVVDAEVKPLEKKPKSFGQLLGDVHAAFHGAIDGRDESRETPVEQPPHSETTTVFVPAPDDKPILEERPGHDPRTRRLGGNEEFEDQEDNVNP